MLITALLRRVDLPVHIGYLFVHRLQQPVIALDALPGQDGQLSILHIAHPPGMLDDGRDVAGQKIASVSIPQDQRAIFSDSNDLVRIVGTQDAKGIGPLDPVKHLPHRLQQIPLIEILNELGHHLRIRIGQEGNALTHQKGLQFPIVFNDPVVDHGDLAALAHLGMGIDIAGRPVGGPAGVTDAHGALDRRPVLELVGQYLQPALSLVDRKGVPILVIDSHPCRVIAPVLQSGQSFQKNGSCLLLANIAYNSAHILFSS